MKFDGGYLGACIIVLSLLLGTAGCLLLNVNETPVSTTRYDYVTDITGLFNISDEPQYIDFNPATNYTGYVNYVPSIIETPSGLVFTETSTANNYRILTRAGDTVAGSSGTVDNSTSLAQASFNYSPRVPNIANSDRVNNTAVTAQLSGFKVASLYTWLSSVFTLSDYSHIDMDLTYPANHKPTEKAGIASFTYDTTGDNPYTSVSISQYQSLKIDPDNMTVQFKLNGSWLPNSYSLYDCYIVYGDATQHETYIQPGPTWASGDYSTSLSLSYTSQVTTTNEYAYMVPSNGVSTPNIGATIWDNDTISTDYDNYKVDILVGFPFVNGVYTEPSYDARYLMTMPTDVNDTHDGVLLYWTKSTGQFSLSVYHAEDINNDNVLDYDYQINSQDIGAFPAIMLSLERDADNNITVSAYGVTTFNNYMDATTAPAPLASAVMSDTHDLDSIYMNSGDWLRDPLNWSVYNTTIYMNTYNAVMINPSIDLADYWADMDSYRYAFQSFAIYGDSVTINGETYTIEDEQITIDGKKYKFNNVWLSFSAQGKTSITFRDINRTIDLGDTQDKEVSFSGIWYFTTGLYEGVETSEDVYEWDINDPLGKLDLDTIFLLALGGLAIISLIFIALKFNFKPMDKVILIFGGVIFFCLLGGF